MKEDFFAGRIGVRRVASDGDKWGDGPSDEYLSFNSYSRDNDEYYYIRITLSGTATSTRAALEKLADSAVPGWADTAEIIDGLD